VVASQSRVAASTKVQILLAAERLFGEHGLDGVSLRQISVAAGTAHNSAVQYHFGTKDQLINAIFEYRLPQIDARRELRIAERRPNDLRGWVECAVLPILEQAEMDGSHYQRFVAMLAQHRYDVLACLPPESRAANDRLFDELVKLLPRVPNPIRQLRLSRMFATAVNVGAERENAREVGAPLLPFAVYANDLVDTLVSFVSAPVSRATASALRDSEHRGER
jgi:AcrR family transcriptional regulator